MNLKFSKMHGLGNDFMVIDGVKQSINLTADDIQQLSRRDTGIGFDQCLIVKSSSEPNIDFFYHIYNANGESVGQCGNGARCLARFIQRTGLSNKKLLTVKTITTTLQLQINHNNTVTVNMGLPEVSPEQIRFNIEENEISVHAVNIGNTHAVLMVSELTHAPVHTLGKTICESPIFPNQTNVEFAKIIDSAHMKLRVYERGCGETQACGSGAVAAAVVGRLYYQMDPEIFVHLPGGELLIEWPDINGPIYLTGPATFIYDGTLHTE